MSNYTTLPSTAYPYKNDYHPMKSESHSQHVMSVSSNVQQSNIMSINQPDTPRPEEMRSPPLSEKLEASPNLIRKNTPVPSRSASFSTFHSNPYPRASPVRRRRTESIFSFEMGPAFTATKQLHELYSMDQSNGYQVQLHAKMDRGFFRADQDWTCYRRNYFQVSSTFDIHGLNYLIQGPETPCLLRKTDTQEIFQVDYFSIGVSARITNHDKKIELVQHTPKRDKGPQVVPEPRPVRAGGNLHLASVGTNHNIVTFERLQFKTATANNGKRRAAQQYYEIVVSLYANINREEAICVATSVSSPLVVRGRSPGHYADSHTRFKNMDSDPAGISGPIPSVPMGTSVPAERYGNSVQQNSPGHQFGSLPNSPLSDFGPYSYNNYQYQVPGYPPPMISPSDASSQYPNHSVPLTNEQRNNYWSHQTSKMNHSQPTPSQMNSGMSYMSPMETYARAHNTDPVSFSSVSDAGRS